MEGSFGDGIENKFSPYTMTVCGFGARIYTTNDNIPLCIFLSTDRTA